MEEKINNQKIFCYVPSTIIKLVLDTELTDKDVFCDNTDLNTSKVYERRSNRGFSRFSSLFINPDIFPIDNQISYSLIMKVRLKGFQKLMSTLIVKDPRNLKENLFSEYLSIILPRKLLKITGIIAENGGEVIKYNDYEFTALWTTYNPTISKMTKNKKFLAKYALISAYEIMTKVDDMEIAKGVKMEISIGMAMGNASIVFFGGERKRAEYVIMGEAMQKAQICLDNSFPHEIFISQEINDLFKNTLDINTEIVEGTTNVYSIICFDLVKLKDFSKFKGMKLSNNIIYMNKDVYENLAKKIYIFSSILPNGLIKYLDVGEEENLRELNMVTVVTININIDQEMNNDLNQIQNIIFDIQKATYLTMGSLLYIEKTISGILIRCVWGIDPSSFIDDTARAITTSIIIGKLTKFYKVKIAIGIATGSCFTGLITLQGNKKYFSLLGKKANLSRVLSEEAYKVINKNLTQKKYLIYCDKLTMRQSQKWYRHIYATQIKTHLYQKDNKYYESQEEYLNEINYEKYGKKYDINDFDSELSEQRMQKSSLKMDFKRDEENMEINDEKRKEYDLINEIYTPIEDENFVPSYYDPFPFIRTHLNNSFNTKNKLYYDYIFNSKKETKHTMTKFSLTRIQKDQKIMDKLLNSQVVFGQSDSINRFVKVLDAVYKNNERQFILVKGPLGVGKSLFVRKGLNNFLGKSDILSKYYYLGEQFLFSNIMNPFTMQIPYNTIAFILRKIYLNLKKIKKIKKLCEISQKCKLDNEDLKNISFVLSLGNYDIDLIEDFEPHRTIDTRNFSRILMEKNQKLNASTLNNKIFSAVGLLEGPYTFKETFKTNNFFFHMIKLYKKYLNHNYHKNFQADDNDNIPLILVLDDVQYSNQYSIDFIQFLFNNKDEILNPFIIILVEQTPFNENFHPLIHGVFENFLKSFTEYFDEPDDSKFICFNILPLIDKSELKKLIVFSYKDLVLTNYKTNLENVDEKILDFLLMKSFNGIPLLALKLFESLLKSGKFIQVLSGEFIITSELIDDNTIFDWSDIILPYVYEKIVSMSINNLLNFKDILIVKFACILGNIFDLNSLNKINPLQNIIKIKDLEKVFNKLANESIAEIFTEEIEKREGKLNIIYKFCFPLMREVLYKKFLMEKRSILHMKAGVILSASKKIKFFSAENDLKILKRHLLCGEMNIINEIESKEIKTVQDILQNRKVLNYNNLKLLLVKELCYRFCFNNTGNIMEGNLEFLNSSKWLRINYYISRDNKIYFKLKNESIPILVLPIQKIYKNFIKTKNDNLLEIYVSEDSIPLKKKTKKMYLFRSTQYEEICKLDIAIKFLRVKVNYDNYAYAFGVARFPLYKLKWFMSNEKKYYPNFDVNPNFIKRNVKNSKNAKRRTSNFGYFNLDKLFDKTQFCKKSFNYLFKCTLGIFLGKVQEKISSNKIYKKFILGIDTMDDYENDIFRVNPYVYYYFTIPEHLIHPINTYIAKRDPSRKNLNLVAGNLRKFYLDKIYKIKNDKSGKKDKKNNSNNTNSNSSSISNSLNVAHIMSKNTLYSERSDTNSNNISSKNSITCLRTMNTMKEHLNKETQLNSDSMSSSSFSYSSNSQNIKKRNSKKSTDSKNTATFRNEEALKINKINAEENKEMSLNEKEIDNLLDSSDIFPSQEDTQTNIFFPDELNINKNDEEKLPKEVIINDDELIIEKNDDYNNIMTEESSFAKSLQNFITDADIQKDKMCSLELPTKKKIKESKESKEYKEPLNTDRNIYNNNQIRNNFMENYDNDNNEEILLEDDLKNFSIADNNLFKDRSALPADFVPKIKKVSGIKHVQVVPSLPTENYRQKIKVYDITKTDWDEYNKSYSELKTVKLEDNPKYAYIEDNLSYRKVHKSNFFKNVKKSGDPYLKFNK